MQSNRPAAALPLALLVLSALPLPLMAQDPPQLGSVAVALLRKGPAWTDAETPEHAALQARHQAYLLQLAQGGDLALAGPISDQADPDVRGVVVSRRHGVERLREIMSADPKVQAEHLRLELFRWWIPTFMLTPALDGAADARSSGPLRSVAMRVRNLEAMESFYAAAFGVTFRSVRTGDIDSRFGDLDGITIKLVPIRDSTDFEGYPIHQLGLEVESLDRVVDIALRAGGARHGEMVTVDGVRQIAIRDPDGNLLELYERGARADDP